MDIAPTVIKKISSMFKRSVIVVLWIIWIILTTTIVFPLLGIFTWVLIGNNIYSEFTYWLIERGAEETRY